MMWRYQSPLASSRRVRGRRSVALVPAVAVHDHLDPAHLRHHVRTSGQLGHGRLPDLEDLVAASGVGTDPDGPAEVVEDDDRVGERVREVGQVGDVGVIDPALEREPVGAQVRVAATELGIEEQMLGPGRTPRHDGRLRPGGPVADAAEALGAGRDLRLEHRCHAVTEEQVRRPHDAGRHPGLTVLAARAHGGDALHELRLAHDTELFRTVRPIHRGALDEHGLTDVVRVRVLKQLLQQVAVARAIPQMVVRVDDGQLRLQHCLVGQRQPVGARTARRRRPLGLGARAHRAGQTSRCRRGPEGPRRRSTEERPSRDVIHGRHFLLLASTSPPLRQRRHDFRCQ